MSLSSRFPTITAVAVCSWWLVLAVTLLVPANAGAVSGHDQQTTIAPSTILIELPEQLGEAKRPPAQLDHAKHTDALEQEGVKGQEVCKTCHAFTPEGELIPSLPGSENLTTRKELASHYHDTCIDCHKEKAAKLGRSLPVTCGECHQKLAGEPVLLRSPMAFDYSLHERHVKGLDKKCESCHHQWDPASQRLVWVEKQEGACRDCHGATDTTHGEQGRKLPSLSTASHTDCISCHLRLAEQGKEHGPSTCVGCHDAAHQQAWKRLPPEEIPRMKRDQPDLVWIHSQGGSSRVVSFDHQSHEGETSFCTSCHHKTLKACKECHTLTGSDEGNQVTAAVSYHTASSGHSCVGCHRTTTASRSCNGCHSRLPRPPTERACVVCHSGPLPPAEAEMPGGMGETEDQEPTFTAAHPAPVTLAALPAYSNDGFPETVTIGSLANEYEPTTLPHGKIVAKLDEMVRSSKLASQFHGQTEVLCAGCHHQSPIGARPGPCRACHSDTAAPTTDKPALKAAYHRQCIGCHQEMQIKALECTSCHAKKGVQP